MRRLALVSFLLVSAASAGPDLEARIAEIERINVTQPWQQSAALIEKMAPDLTGATIEQRTRVELLRLRNLALAGDNRAGIDKVQSLLEQTLPPAQRIRAYSLGVNMAANIGDHQRAFTWLKEGLAILPERGDGRVRFLGMASYLYALVGEREWSLDFADK
ncbi:MAG: tetrapyrrole methylase, partial [Lysobacterales bacterium CG02_land_8_20_14_3_00_62_12]